MTLEETRKRIFEDEDFVIEEAKKLRTLYVLKNVIRYDMNRDEEIDSESVAEHIYGMHVLTAYFAPLEDTENGWDKTRIHELIDFHDIDEIETGDFVSYSKTAAQIEAGKEAIPRVIEKLPHSMQPRVTDLLNEYETQATTEARFVKAIDKLEPSFHIFSENGVKINHNVTNVTYEQHRNIKDPYTKFFPLIHHFNDVLSRYLQREGFFSA